MTTLSSKSKKVSLSDHVKRRRSSAALSSYGSGAGSGGGVCGSSTSGASDGNNGSSRATYEQHHPTIPPSRGEYEGGYDSHAASYGNYDAPPHGSSAYGRNYGMSNDHGCYAAESYISSSGISGSGSHDSKPLEPTRRDGHSDAEIDSDLEGQRCAANEEVRPIMAMPRSSNHSSCGNASSRQRRPPRRYNGGLDPALRISQASTLPMGPREIPQEYPHPSSSSWEEESSSCYHPKSSQADSSYYPKSQDSATTASTASSSSSSGSSSSISSGNSNNISGRTSVLLEEEAIRQGIMDLSTLLATWIAGALSFIIGILLTVLSPIVKCFRLIAGDVRGLLGDVGFVQDLSSLWRMYGDLRRRGGRSTHPRRYQDGRHYCDDESTTDANSTVYTDASPQPAQFVGGWQPRVSVGGGGPGTSAANGGASANSGTSTTSSRRTSSRSYSSLPLVYEDQYQDVHPPRGGGIGAQSSVVPTVPPSFPKIEIMPSDNNNNSNVVYQEHARGGASSSAYYQQQYGSRRSSTMQQQQHCSLQYDQHHHHHPSSPTTKKMMPVQQYYSPQKRHLPRSRSGVGLIH